MTIHFHSSVMLGSAAMMDLRTAANVLPRQFLCRRSACRFSGMGS